MEYIDVFVFLYNGNKYIEQIRNECDLQQCSKKINLIFVVTETNDGSKEKLDELKENYILIAENDFSHSLTRERVLMNSTADIAILLTQDCRLVNNDVIEVLSSYIDDDVKFAYLRQINSNKTIERYTRAINYPTQSIIKDENMIKILGLNTFFASDACAAYDVNYFKDINGYDQKKLPTNEDMYYARKVILGGKKIRYCAETYVDHTHKFTLKQIYKRYYLVGRFFAMCPEFKEYNSEKSGWNLALKTLGMIIKEFNLYALFTFIPNMIARYCGKKKGQNGKNV